MTYLVDHLCWLHRTGILQLTSLPPFFSLDPSPPAASPTFQVRPNIHRWSQITADDYNRRLRAAVHRLLRSRGRIMVEHAITMPPIDGVVYNKTSSKWRKLYQRPNGVVRAEVMHRMSYDEARPLLRKRSQSSQLAMLPISTTRRLVSVLSAQLSPLAIFRHFVVSSGLDPRRYRRRLTEAIIAFNHRRAFDRCLSTVAQRQLSGLEHQNLV